MATFHDPAERFEPVEVVERLLEICEYFGRKPALHVSSSLDLAIYLDSFGFDIYSLTGDTSEAFDIQAASTQVLPSGDRSHSSFTAH